MSGKIIKTVFLGKKPHLYSYWLFKNHSLINADPHSCYKILTCNKHILKTGAEGVKMQLANLIKMFEGFDSKLKDKTKPVDMNATLIMQMKFT